MQLPAACQGCLRQKFKLASDMNTQKAVANHQSSFQPPWCAWMVSLCGSTHCGQHEARSKVIKKQPYSLVDYMLQWILK